MVSLVASARSITLPPPEMDLPPDRFHEHVNGAAPALSALGCRRLRFWRLSDPEIELEILEFRDDSGARAALDKVTGNARSSNVPGNEGWTNWQVVYFRRGKVYCRLIANVGPPVQGLVERAFSVDKSLQSGEISM